MNLLIEFQNELITGINEIDKQHKELFNNINRILIACLTKKEIAEVQYIIQTFEKHAESHFQNEEKLMKKTNFKNYHAHKRAHRLLKMTITGAKEEFNIKGPSIALAIKTKKLMADNLISHLSEYDFEMAKYLKNIENKECITLF